MRRAPLLAIAAAVAVAAPLLVILASASNRAGEPEAEVELTERELRLVPLGEGRRWAVLRLDWNRDLQWTQKEPGWFDGAKLAALGFDTRLPANDPRASGFYGWQPAREVFLALEHDGPAAAAADARIPGRRPVALPPPPRRRRPRRPGASRASPRPASRPRRSRRRRRRVLRPLGPGDPQDVGPVPEGTDPSGSSWRRSRSRARSAPSSTPSHPARRFRREPERRRPPRPPAESPPTRSPATGSSSAPAAGWSRGSPR